MGVRQRLRHDHGEDGVRAGRLAVHVGGRHRAGLVALRHQVVDVLKRADCKLRQPVDVRPQHVVLPHFQGLLVGLGVQEVMHLLVVDLHVADFHLVGELGALALGDGVEEGVAESGDDALAVPAPHHGVRLARPGLSVGEDARVVALERVLQDVPAEAVEHLLLAREARGRRVQRVEAVVEGERLGLFPLYLVQGVGVVQDRLLALHLDHAFCPELKLSSVKWTDPHRYLNLIRRHYCTQYVKAKPQLNYMQLHNRN